jgi:hypothetical protein
MNDDQSVDLPHPALPAQNSFVTQNQEDIVLHWI